MAQDESRELVTRFLLEKARQEPYPSTTHLDLIEQSIPCYMMREYLDLLMDKAAQDRFPSIPMLRRMLRVAACVPPRTVDGHARQGDGRQERADAPRTAAGAPAS